MVFFIDDMLFRMAGFSIPPFDMLWLMETIGDYAKQLQAEETRRLVVGSMKENRLLYELKEITQEEYEKRSRELSQKLKDIERADYMNLKQRVNILGHT